MYRAFVIGLFLFAVQTSCNSRSDRNNVSGSDTVLSAKAVPFSDTVCYRQVVGRDTTMLHLFRQDTTVSGRLEVLPFEKDRAVGTLTGNQTGKEIRAIWNRSGEGVTQPYELRFTINGDSIRWREGERIEHQGTWVLKNPAQGYEYVLTRTDNCQ